MIWLGMPVLMNMDDLESCAALCRELGLDFIELNMNLPEYQADTMDIERLKRIAAAYGIYYTLHLDENLNICDFNPFVAKAWLDTVTASIHLARQLSVPVLNMHLSDGVYFTLPDKKVYLYDRYQELYLSALENFCDACVEAIGGDDITICLENTGLYREFQTTGIQRLLQSDCFALTYDIGHAAGYQPDMDRFILSRLPLRTLSRL